MTNTLCWVDIPVSNLDRAITFYSKVLANPVEKMSEHGFEFGLLPHLNENASGCLCVMEDRKPGTQGPLIYLNVEGRLNDAVQVTKNNGGKVLKEAQQIGPYGNRAVILDSEGNEIALYSKHA